MTEITALFVDLGGVLRTVEVYQLTLDLAQVEPRHVAYLEDRAMFVEVAAGLGIHGVLHTGLESTHTTLEKLGLVLEGWPVRSAEGDVK